jgi:hypothetical protein
MNCLKSDWRWKSNAIVAVGEVSLCCAGRCGRATASRGLRIFVFVFLLRELRLAETIEAFQLAGVDGVKEPLDVHEITLRYAIRDGLVAIHQRGHLRGVEGIILFVDSGFAGKLLDVIEEDLANPIALHSLYRPLRFAIALFLSCLHLRDALFERVFEVGIALFPSGFLPRRRSLAVCNVALLLQPGHHVIGDGIHLRLLPVAHLHHGVEQVRRGTFPAHDLIQNVGVGELQIGFLVSRSSVRFGRCDQAMLVKDVADGSLEFVQLFEDRIGRALLVGELAFSASALFALSFTFSRALTFALTGGALPFVGLALLVISVALVISVKRCESRFGAPLRIQWFTAAVIF